MIVGFCFIWASALLLNICTADEVSLQVVGVFGDSVVFPCSSSEDELKIEDINVHWRHNGSVKVYDIIKGRATVEYQNSKYKNRAESFPEEYEKGNFSLKLKNLTHTDAGVFQCFMGTSLVNVRLLVNDTTKTKENSPAEKGNGAAETKLMWIRILIPVLCVFLLLCI